jgi:inosine-uridine nucleoside N-ribohydrolase
VRALWVDTDIALGAARGDVDDGFALAAVLGAVRRGEVSLLGVSTVSGNVDAATAADCARHLCAAAGVSVVVAQGVQGAARIAAAQPGTMIVALGPLTNLAAACRADPGLPPRAGLAVVGGNLSSGGRVPPLWPFEFNLTRDRAATREVFGLHWERLTLYPLDVVRRLRVGGARLEELAAVSPLGELLADGSRRWLARSRWQHGGRGFPVWDLPAALDSMGALDRRCESVAAPPALRRLTGRAELDCLVDFDPDGAWRRFLALVG